MPNYEMQNYMLKKFMHKKMPSPLLGTPQLPLIWYLFCTSHQAKELAQKPHLLLRCRALLSLCCSCQSPLCCSHSPVAQMPRVLVHPCTPHSQGPPPPRTKVNRRCSHQMPLRNLAVGRQGFQAMCASLLNLQALLRDSLSIASMENRTDATWQWLIYKILMLGLE